jgi:hypothetical protein
MSFVPNATQAQTLLRLLFIPEEPAISKLQPKLPPDKRNALVNAGLIALEKRGRAQHLLLTDHGWAWSADNLNRLCPRTLNRLRPEILEAVLAAIDKNMALRGLSLAEVVRPEMFANEPPSQAPNATEDRSEAMRSELLPEVIRGVCRKLLAEERPGSMTRTRLADLRRALPHVARSLLDATLLDMQANNEIVLSTLERYDVTDDDRAAVIRIAGLPRHVVYLK